MSAGVRISGDRDGTPRRSRDCPRTLALRLSRARDQRPRERRSIAAHDHERREKAVRARASRGKGAVTSFSDLAACATKAGVRPLLQGRSESKRPAMDARIATRERSVASSFSRSRAPAPARSARAAPSDLGRRPRWSYSRLSFVPPHYDHSRARRVRARILSRGRSRFGFWLARSAGCWWGLPPGRPGIWAPAASTTSIALS
jgi:hypothetical protein